jgi:hypothetical protein
MFIEGLPDVEALAILMADASRSMREIELKTGEPKHRCIASMIQEILNGMDDPQYEFANATVACFSADSGGAKVVSLLEDHNPYTLKTYTQNPHPDYWDPLSPDNCTQGMGNLTPLGTALAWARAKAEQWVNAADGQVQRRAVIYLLSDGMNNYGPDGRAEKTAIVDFNAACEKGYIRLATIGYFQSPPGTNPEEDAGRQFLQDLPLNLSAYFESDNAADMVRYILSTTTQVMHHA